jgi:hypothetical protein
LGYQRPFTKELDAKAGFLELEGALDLRTDARGLSEAAASARLPAALFANRARFNVACKMGIGAMPISFLFQFYTILESKKSRGFGK